MRDTTSDPIVSKLGGTGGPASTLARWAGAGGLLLVFLLWTGAPLRAQTGPPAPENVRANAVDSARIDLVWNSVGGLLGGAASYNLYRDGARIASTEDTIYSDTELEPGTTYTYRVRAVNHLGNEGPPSAAATATTPDPEDTSPPTVPTDVRATARDSTSIAVTWSASRDEGSGVEHYRVFRGDAVVSEPDTTAFRDEGLQPGTSYTYRLSAVNADGAESDRSAVATATTGRAADRTPPAAPTDLRRAGR